MKNLLLSHSITQQWQSILKEAQARISIFLQDELESYLIFLLTRFTTQPHIANNILAIEFLEGLNKEGQHQHDDQLREVGDKCLLFSGLFPGRAERLHLKINYFVQLGQTAYRSASPSNRHELKLYQTLSQSFIPMMDVLQNTRDLPSQISSISLIAAFELWHDTGSRAAHQQFIASKAFLKN